MCETLREVGTQHFDFLIRSIAKWLSSLAIVSLAAFANWQIKPTSSASRSPFAFGFAPGSGKGRSLIVPPDGKPALDS
jgi:hypothetical protein